MGNRHEVYVYNEKTGELKFFYCQSMYGEAAVCAEIFCKMLVDCLKYGYNFKTVSTQGFHASHRTMFQGFNGEWICLRQGEEKPVHGFGFNGSDGGITAIYITYDRKRLSYEARLGFWSHNVLANQHTALQFVKTFDGQYEKPSNTYKRLTEKQLATLKNKICSEN